MSEVVPLFFVAQRCSCLPIDGKGWVIPANKLADGGVGLLCLHIKETYLHTKLAGKKCADHQVNFPRKFVSKSVISLAEDDPSFSLRFGASLRFVLYLLLRVDPHVVDACSCSMYSHQYSGMGLKGIMQSVHPKNEFTGPPTWVMFR